MHRRSFRKYHFPGLDCAATQSDSILETRQELQIAIYLHCILFSFHPLTFHALSLSAGSYKLWHAYLTERKGAMRGQPLTHPGYEALNNTFERALVTMHKMPRIWLDYLQLLLDQRRISRTRHTFDRALCSLPVTQHDRIWELYVRFVRQDAVPVETALRVYRRYLKFDPTQAEDFINFLQEVRRATGQEAPPSRSSVLSWAGMEGSWLSRPCPALRCHPAACADAPCMCAGGPLAGGCCAAGGLCE